jgi:pyruvate formate lyase activating enzyme
MKMIIGGFQKVSLQDFPGNIACIVFTQGCNFNCGYCHNHELINSQKNNDGIELEDFFKYIEKRKNLLDGVVITGGEPTLQKDLVDFMIKIKSYSLNIKLDTNGSNPKMLEQILKLNLVDYIAMDYKFSLDNYKKIISLNYNLENIKLSKKIIMASSINSEFRITVIPELFDDLTIKKISNELYYAKKVILQRFNNKKINNKDFQNYSNTNMKFLKNMKNIMDLKCKNVLIRDS